MSKTIGLPGNDNNITKASSLNNDTQEKPQEGVFYQTKPNFEHKNIQSSHSQKQHCTDKIQTKTPGNIFEQKKPNPF